MRRGRRFSGDLKSEVGTGSAKRSKGLARCSRTVWAAVGEIMKAMYVSFTPRSAN